MGIKLRFIVAFILLVLGIAEAATIVVPPPPASIQNAINGASDGDTIQLSAGTYIQEVQVISKSLDIIGAGQGVSIIQSPDASTHLTQNFTFEGIVFWCIVMIDNQAAPTSHTVNISNLTVDGSNQQDTTIAPIYGSSDRFFAIGYHNTNGTVQNVHTTNTRQTANFNEVAGGGILNASDTGSVAFSVTNCLVDFYQRIGIDCRGPTLTATVSNNTVNRGYILTPNTSTATPNGIQFSHSAVGSITGNLVSENVGTVANAAGSGIIPFAAGANVVVSGNTLDNNDAGIAAVSCGNNLQISSNTVNFTITPGVNSPEGILVQEPDGLTTLSANIMNNISTNMDLTSSTTQSFQLMNNQFIGGQTGLLITGNTTVGPIVTMDTDSFTGTSGYFIEEVTSPNDVWPSSATVFFDGLLSGHMTLAEFNFVLSKILGNHTDPSLGVVLQFIIPVPPTLSGISPTSGPQTGGTLVTITGSSFISSNTQVFFGSTPATNVTVVSNNEITATAPPGVGTVDVTVVTPFGTTPITPNDQYTYIPTLLPAVTGIDPNFGPTTGGNVVTVTGTNFIIGNTQVFFGNTLATQVTVVSDTLLLVVAPPGAGTTDVRVATSFGISPITSADQYTYIPVPPIHPLPPSCFKGCVRKNKCSSASEYILKATWHPSPSPRVVFYRIYKGKRLVEQVPNEPPLIFITSLHSKYSARKFFISAVNSDGLESKRVKIKISHCKDCD